MKINFHAGVSPKICPHLTKLLLIMKLTALIMLIACLHVSARGFSQTMSFHGKNVSLPDVFSAIKKQTGFVVFYNVDDLNGLKPVTLEARNMPLRDLLAICLKDQPLVYTIQNKTIAISRKAIVAPATNTIPSAPTDVHGHVTDSVGNPLAGASVAVKGTKTVVSTNDKGDFTLTGLDGGAILVISFIGYDTKEIRLNGKEIYTVRIALKHNSSPLDEVQIIAYGTTTQRFNVGSIATVNADIIEKQPVTNLLLALEGQVPGLAVNATSGVPGSRVELQIRGQNTLMTTSASLKPYDQPLFIIDGVPFAPQNNNISQLSSLARSFSGGISQAVGLSPFNGINPADIESISVLKDADATSIYGTQGSNGVILITTKKGRPGKTVFNLTANTGFNTSARMVKLMNTEQYLQFRTDAFAADGIVPSNNPANYSAYAPDVTVFDQNRYTDWPKVIYGKTSNNTDIHASLSGGTVNNTFLLSGGYTRSDFNFPGNFADQRLTMHGALHHVSQDNRLTMDLGFDYSYDQNNSGGSGSGQDILLPPNTPALLDASGNLVWNYDGVDMSQYQFYAYLKEPVDLQNYNLNNTLRLAYKVFSGLTLTVNMGYSRNTSSEHSEFPAAAQSPLYVNRTASFATDNFQTVNVEPQVDYTKNIGKGVLTALLGGTYKKNNSNSTTTQGSGYVNDDFLGSINGAATVYATDNTSLYKYSAGFARLKYIYDQKYIVSLTGRRDGSSNFGPGNQFGNFGSVGAGWIFSEEKAFKATLPFITYGKLSGSYGTNGSDGVAPYKYQAFWQPSGTIPAFQGIRPDVPLNLYNPDYSWALKRSLNAALDLGFLHNLLLLNATYYRDREGNQLAGYPLPIHTGFSSVLENLPAKIQNQGWEFTLTSNNIKTKAFSWSSNFNISFNRNKLLSFPNLAGSSFANLYMIGKPTSIVFGSRYKDVNPTTGLFEYYTSGGQATSNPNYSLPANGGDLAPIANREVRYMGGFGNNFTYKRFSLYVFFQFSSQEAPTYLATVYSAYTPGLSAYNQPLPVMNYWKKQGDNAPLQRLISGYGSTGFQSANDFATSSGVYGDDTYMRLKTVALSYALPETFLKRLHIHDCRLYINAQNLLTFTDYKVGDAETFSDYTSFPLQRTIAFGLNLNF
jgi:TonB-linked SusC/RagA family outer membrane protein